jgi:FtsP/CotA-like multicopper oxidase with cupredoxin domain
MAPYAWSLNGEYWPNVTPLMIATDQRVAIEILNQTMMPHPMHLHGHAFQVIARTVPHSQVLCEIPSWCHPWAVSP